MGWAFTGVTLPRLSTVRAGLEVVRLRELTLVFILTLFAGRVTGEKEKGRREKNAKARRERQPFPSLPLTPLISHPFRRNSFYTKTQFCSRVTGEKRKGEGGLREKAWEGKGRGSPSPFSLISLPWFPRPLLTPFPAPAAQPYSFVLAPVFRKFHNWQLLKV